MAKGSAAATATPRPVSVHSTWWTVTYSGAGEPGSPSKRSCTSSGPSVALARFTAAARCSPSIVWTSTCPPGEESGTAAGSSGSHVTAARAESGARPVARHISAWTWNRRACAFESGSTARNDSSTVIASASSPLRTSASRSSSCLRVASAGSFASRIACSTAAASQSKRCWMLDRVRHRTNRAPASATGVPAGSFFTSSSGPRKTSTSSQKMYGPPATGMITNRTKRPRVWIPVVESRRMA